MKLASLNDGTRDGALMVVSRDLARCTSAARIAPTLQAALMIGTARNWRCRPCLPICSQVRFLARPLIRQQRIHHCRAPSMARWIGLCQSCESGSQGAGCGNAGEFLDRSVDDCGRIG